MNCLKTLTIFFYCFNTYDFNEELSGYKNVSSDVTMHIDSGTVFNLFR